MNRRKNCDSRTKIYIPLWFYSNFFTRKFLCYHNGIYIPLWFYSNKNIVYVDTDSCKFTFHYGSILIQQIRPNRVFIIIYIPLWFYSNLWEKLSKDYESRFTFHYGSILIWQNLYVKSIYVNLHSTMVLF